MQITVRGHNIEVTPPLRDYALKRIEKTEQFSKHIISAEVELEFRPVKDLGKTQVCKVTMHLRDTSLRAESESGDMYASIDAVLASLENQVKKYKEKHRIEGRRHAHDIKTSVAAEANAQPTAGEPLIVPVKTFAPKPMSEVEAKEELKVLDQEFVVFSNRKTKNINVAYKADGGFQILGPENSEILECNPEAAGEALNNSQRTFIMFKNPQTAELNVLYRRKSGDFGLIQPGI